MDTLLSLAIVVSTSVLVYLAIRWARSRGTRSRGTSVVGNIMKLYNEMYMPSAAKSIEQRIQHDETGAPGPTKGKVR